MPTDSSVERHKRCTASMRCSKLSRSSSVNALIVRLERACTSLSSVIRDTIRAPSSADSLRVRRALSSLPPYNTIMHEECVCARTRHNNLAVSIISGERSMHKYCCTQPVFSQSIGSAARDSSARIHTPTPHSTHRPPCRLIAWQTHVHTPTRPCQVRCQS